MLVRLATALDLDELSALVRESFAELRQYDVPDNSALTISLLTHALSLDHAQPIAVAEDADTHLVGYRAWIENHYAPTQLLGTGVYVKPEYRRHGLSNELAEACKHFAREMGFSRVEAAIYWRNRPGLAAALKQGGEVCGYLVAYTLEGRP